MDVAGPSIQTKTKLTLLGKWSDDKYIKLFEFHKANPMLWKKNHEKYIDTARKNRLLSEIGKKLGCSGEEAKLRFRSMKQTYQKCCKKMLKSGSVGGVQKEWRFAKNLSFLSDELPKSEPSSVANSTDGKTETKFLIASPTTTTTKTTVSSKRRKKDEDDSDEREMVYRSFLSKLKNKRDKYDEYGEVLASLLRRIGNKNSVVAEELELKWHAEAIERLRFTKTSSDDIIASPSNSESFKLIFE